MNSHKDTEKDTEIKSGFDELSEFYDYLSFFLDSSKLMIKELNLTDVSKVLDVATGTGHTAIELAKALPTAEVIGTDISSPMLKKAILKSCNLSNIEFKQLDMMSLAALQGNYDLVCCSFGTYFANDLNAFIKNASLALNKNGKIVLINYVDDSFMPYGMVLLSDLHGMGLIKEYPVVFSAHNCSCQEALRSAGLSEIKTVTKQLKYSIGNSADWWKVVTGTAFKWFLIGLTPQEHEILKRQHLGKIDTMIAEGRNIYDVNILITIAEGPSR